MFPKLSHQMDFQRAVSKADFASANARTLSVGRAVMLDASAARRASAACSKVSGVLAAGVKVAIISFAFPAPRRARPETDLQTAAAQRRRSKCPRRRRRRAAAWPRLGARRVGARRRRGLRRL